MKVGELMSEMAGREWRGLGTEAQARQLADDYRAAGIQDGPDLHTAWNNCRTQIKRKVAPTAAAFLEYYPIHPKADIKADIPLKPSSVAWAEKVLRLPEGQEALANGAGLECEVWAKKNPGTIPNMEDVKEWIASTVAHIRFVAELGQAETALQKSYLECAKAMKERERKLVEEYRE